MLTHPPTSSHTSSHLSLSHPLHPKTIAVTKSVLISVVNLLPFAFIVPRTDFGALWKPAFKGGFETRKIQTVFSLRLCLLNHSLLLLHLLHVHQRLSPASLRGNFQNCSKKKKKGKNKEKQKKGGINLVVSRLLGMAEHFPNSRFCDWARGKGVFVSKIGYSKMPFALLEPHLPSLLPWFFFLSFFFHTFFFFPIFLFSFLFFFLFTPFCFSTFFSLSSFSSFLVFSLFFLLFCRFHFEMMNLFNLPPQSSHVQNLARVLPLNFSSLSIRSFGFSLFSCVCLSVRQNRLTGESVSQSVKSFTQSLNQSFSQSFTGSNSY